MKRSFYCNVIGMVLLMVGAVVSWAVIPLLWFGIPETASETDWFYYILIILISSCIGCFLFIFGIVTCAAKISFDEKGIHKSVLGIFLKKHIAWSELFLMKLYPSINGQCWIAFSKEDITNLNWNKWSTRRKTICLMFNNKVFQSIRMFTSMDINGYDKNKKY